MSPVEPCCILLSSFDIVLKSVILGASFSIDLTAYSILHTHGRVVKCFFSFSPRLSKSSFGRGSACRKAKAPKPPPCALPARVRKVPVKRHLGCGAAQPKTAAAALRALRERDGPLSPRPLALSRQRSPCEGRRFICRPAVRCSFVRRSAPRCRALRPIRPAVRGGFR